jgi:hypothetical protein
MEPNGTLFRLERLEKDVEKLYAMRGDVTAVRVDALITDVKDMENEVRGIRKALWATALSVSGGAVIFAFTAFQVFGAHA